MFYGISSPFTSTTRWSVQCVEWLKTITFETTYLKEAFGLLIEQYEYLTRQIARINRTVVLLCRDKNYRQKIKLLCTAPGIGKLTAIELLVELQDITRFKSAEEIASYIGLTPAEYSTGERTRQGRNPVRAQAGEDLPGGEHVGPDHERPVPSGKVSQAKEPAGWQEGGHYDSAQIPHTAETDAPGQRALSDGSLTQNMTITLSGYGLTVDLHLVTNKDYVL